MGLKDKIIHASIKLCQKMIKRQKNIFFSVSLNHVKNVFVTIIIMLTGIKSCIEQNPFSMLEYWGIYFIRFRF